MIRMDQDAPRIQGKFGNKFLFPCLPPILNCSNTLYLAYAYYIRYAAKCQAIRYILYIFCALCVCVKVYSDLNIENAGKKEGCNAMLHPSISDYPLYSVHPSFEVMVLPVSAGSRLSIGTNVLAAGLKDR